MSDNFLIKIDLCGMIETMKKRTIRVSERAFHKVREMAKLEPYRTRGCVGVIDGVLFGEFTTHGRGAVKKDSEKDLTEGQSFDRIESNR